MVENEKAKTKTSGKILVYIGWALIFFSVFVLIGMFLQQPRDRDSSIESLLNNPSSVSIISAIIFITASNCICLLALLFGVFALFRKNQKAKPLIITSVIIFVITAGNLFLPSSGSFVESKSNPITVTLPQSEFQIIFPHSVKKNLVTSAGFESIAYESKAPGANPYYRAEFINDIDTTSIGSNFQTTLNNYAKSCGISIPQITVSQDHIGKVGTFSGIKKVGDISIKFYGKMILGEHSAINCLICERLEVFPSESTTIFLGSIKRK